MSEPYLGEIRMVGFNFAPRGWAFCEGQILPINQNQALFSLLGTVYGGDGRTSFGLPDLRGRVAVHAGDGPGLTSRRQGQKFGQENHTLTVNEMPSHNHSLQLSDTAGTGAIGNGKALANIVGDDDGSGTTGDKLYSPAAFTGKKLASGQLFPTGGSQLHSNTQPYIAIYQCIALVGVFPSRN